jgi:molybdate transport system substrate-binding protein
VKLQDGNMIKLCTAASIAALSSLIWADLMSDAGAAEIRVLSATAMKPVLAALTSDFERTSHHKLAIQYEPTVVVKKRIDGGASADVVIVQKPTVEVLANQGKIDPRSVVTLARSGLALGVRRGMPKPDISNVEAFKQALLAAKSISYPNAEMGYGSGIIFRKIVGRLGISAEVDAKAKLQRRPFSEVPTEEQADFVVAQPTQILMSPAFELVGMVPDELQVYSEFTWTAGIMSYAQQADAAAVLVKFLTSSKAALVMKKMSMEPAAF